MPPLPFSAVGVALTVDEFALWLHLEDVYWASEGRKSVNAIFCVLVVTGALIGGADFLSGRIGTATWWSSVSVLAVNLLLSVICLLKVLGGSAASIGPGAAPGHRSRPDGASGQGCPVGRLPGGCDLAVERFEGGDVDL